MLYTSYMLCDCGTGNTLLSVFAVTGRNTVLPASPHLSQRVAVADIPNGANSPLLTRQR